MLPRKTSFRGWVKRGLTFLGMVALFGGCTWVSARCRECHGASGPVEPWRQRQETLEGGIAMLANLCVALVILATHRATLQPFLALTGLTSTGFGLVLHGGYGNASAVLLCLGGLAHAAAHLMHTTHVLGRRFRMVARMKRLKIALLWIITAIIGLSVAFAVASHIPPEKQSPPVVTMTVEVQRCHASAANPA